MHWPDRVVSPGGGTREGLNILDADGRLDMLLHDVLEAATDRYQTLSPRRSNTILRSLSGTRPSSTCQKPVTDSCPADT